MGFKSLHPSLQRRNLQRFRRRNAMATMGVVLFGLLAASAMATARYM